MWYIFTMPQIALSAAPDIFSLNRATHGHRGEEHFQFDDIWCLHLYSNAFKLTLDDEDYHIRPGMLTLIPPGTHMHYRFKDSNYQHYYCLFRLHQHTDAQPQTFSSPVFQLRDEVLQCIRQLFRSAVQNRHLGTHRSACAIHEILWQLISSEDPGRLNPVTQARHIIDSMLNQDIVISRIASDIGISANQLTRLFRKELGMTVIAYIRQQRMQLAKRLIRETELPIKRIAIECGFSDLQYFNKTVRLFFNCSPRQLRKA